MPVPGVTTKGTCTRVKLHRLWVLFFRCTTAHCAQPKVDLCILPSELVVAMAKTEMQDHRHLPLLAGRERIPPGSVFAARQPHVPRNHDQRRCSSDPLLDDGRLGPDLTRSRPHATPTFFTNSGLSANTRSYNALRVSVGARFRCSAIF
jgi:hypothetical protein